MRGKKRKNMFKKWKKLYTIKFTAKNLARAVTNQWTSRESVVIIFEDSWMTVWISEKSISPYFKSRS